MILKSRGSRDPIAKLKSDAINYFISPAELEQRLNEVEQAFGLSKLGLKVTIQDVSHEWGQCSGDPFVIDRINSAGVTIELYITDKSQSADLNVQQKLHQLFASLVEVWGSEYRNNHGGLYLKAAGAEEMFKNSIVPMSSLDNIPQLSVVYIDLDKFKSVNDQCGHDEGDRAIRQVYAEMHKLCRVLGGLAFIDGGDEFILVLPCDRPMDISARLWELRTKIHGLSFGEKKLRIGMTAGVITKSIDDVSKDIHGIKKMCEALTKSGDEHKEKKRGTVSFQSSEDQFDSVKYPVSLSDFFKLGLCFSKSRQFFENCFVDERLNLIVHQVSLLTSFPPQPEEVEAAVADVISWFGVAITDECDERYLLNRSGDGLCISKSSITLAVMHALSRAAINHKWPASAAETLSVMFDESSVQCAVYIDEIKVWGDLDERGHGSISFGSLVGKGSENEKEGVAVGVQIGFDQKPRTPGGAKLPPDFLIDHVRVDIRPRTGGGLPDFWQAALAQVVSALNKAKNPAPVLVWGDTPESTEVFKRLTDLGAWSNDEIANLTGLTTNQVAKIKEQLNGKVLIVNNSDALLDALYNCYLSFSGDERSDDTVAHRDDYSLKRPMISAAALDQSEGIVCKTSREAYPIIIDTLRKAEKIRFSIDDSGQEQRELIAFKLKLMSPLIDRVPDYLADQLPNLEQYASTVLLSDDGIIRKGLESAGQIDAFVSYSARYVGHHKKSRSTRRACLVVPHVPDEHGEPRPLGLISVWATPRFASPSATFLDFVFVWRTVEAFIGFPYSLYGSIKLAEDLINKIANIAGVAVSPDGLQLGELNYVALSLHIGSDEFHTRVAKQIVDSASD
ncbi:diguanylate cyclase [Pseudomonas sp. CDFA 553]|uniref:GGDEF domain-containing protein n=1 Tax=Pseudomonas quasicaspiana TaxID=2829821 RepID=UPI001E410FB7|nr:diguanylate cyclase [Pseudomonas quasicaspiana]MCD5987123.1 diguanylate cyclase [Pseudomonas quasicaspiana]